MDKPGSPFPKHGPRWEGDVDRTRRGPLVLTGGRADGSYPKEGVALPGASAASDGFGFQHAKCRNFAQMELEGSSFQNRKQDISGYPTLGPGLPRPTEHPWKVSAVQLLTKKVDG